MRVELRVETDEHEYEIAIACDRSVTPSNMCYTAQQAIMRLMAPNGVVITKEMIQ